MKEISRLLGLLLLLCAFGTAQGEISMAHPFPAYSYLHQSIGDGRFGLNGGRASVSFNPKRWPGAVADVGAYGPHILSPVITPVHLFGPRFPYRSQSPVTPFAQILFGGARTTVSNIEGLDVSRPKIEKLDLDVYARIRFEGFDHSHVMEYASALFDGIGPRLTGSPNMAKAHAWTRDQLTAMGCTNAHLEDWGEFGMGWQQVNTWVRMVSPDNAVFIAQAAPWSLSTNGAVTGEAAYVVIHDEKDFEQYRGKLAGKIVLLGEMRKVPPLEQPLVHRYTNQELEQIKDFSAGAGDEMPLEMRERLRTYPQRMRLAEEIGLFLADEKVAGVIRPSLDQAGGGGSGGTVVDDWRSDLGSKPYVRGHEMKVPMVVLAIENYGRVIRLLQQHVPVSIAMDVETRFTGDHEHGYNTIAEIAGTDPELKHQVVMLGGHLDSWIAGTGATDNGAGVVVAMEAMRILNALGVHPRRTIRVALWGAEEEGVLGSSGYVTDHFGSPTFSTAQDQVVLPEWMRAVAGPPQIKPEQKLISAYFNLDYGQGKIRGVYLEGNAAIQPIFAEWIAPLRDLGVTTLTMRGIGSTDHVPFDRVGIPGFQFIQDQLDYETRAHHSNQDVYERLEPADLMQAAVVEAIFVYIAAMRDEMLPRKPFSSPQ